MATRIINILNIPIPPHVSNGSVVPIPGPVTPAIASRIDFFGEPTFDPRPLLSRKTKAVYENPSSFYIEPTGPVPVARVLASNVEFLKLPIKLDGLGRLQLHAAGSHPKHLQVGLQCTYKDGDRDRLILDARRPNAHESH